MPNGRFGQQVPQQVNPNILSILKAALIGTGKDIGGMVGQTAQQVPQMLGIGTRVPQQVPPTAAGVLGGAARGTLADIGAIGQLLAPQDILRQAATQPAALSAITQPMAQFGAGFTGQPRVAQAAPPGAPPVTPPPTGAAGQITAAGAPTGAKKGITDQQRQLLAMALQVGLPLALAGFGGERGLAMGAGLAKGLGAAAVSRAETEEKQLERQAKTEQQEIDNRLKIIEEARKQAEAQRKEIEARLKATKGAKKFPGVKKTVEERLAETKGLFRPGEEIAGKVQKVTERALTKPKRVAQEDWDAATKAQRRELLESLR